MEIRTERITLLREALVTQMNHWAFFPIYVMAVVLLSDITGLGTPHLLFWMLFGIAPFLLYLGRHYIQKFWLLTVVHLAVIAIMFIIPAEHLSIRVLYVFLGLIYVIYSAYCWATSIKREDMKLYPLISVFASVLMLYILHYVEHAEWDRHIMITTTIVLGLYFIIYYIEQYLNFLTVNNSSAGHIPAREMFRSGMGLVVGYTGVGILILLIFSNIDWLRGILNSIKSVLLSFIAFLFSLFPREEEVLMEEIVEETTEEMVQYPEITEVGETFWFWNVLEYILEILFIAFLLFVLVKLTMILVKFIKSKLSTMHFGLEKHAEDEVIDVREKCDIIRSTERKIKIPFLQLNPKERIRSLYKKRILASKDVFERNGSDMLSKYTARESSLILQQEEIALVYEKARYSGAECDSEDVKRMREACKRV